MGSLFAEVDFSNLTGLEITGMVIGAIGLVAGGAWLIKNWLDKMS